MSNTKEPFTIGTRVRHLTDETCQEGVVVWKHGESTSVIPSMVGKVWSVHWSNEKRGIYSSDEIKRIPPKNAKKIVEEQLDPEDKVADEEV